MQNNVVLERVKDQVQLNMIEFIKEWNAKYPYDRYWRKKYNVPFGSKVHRQSSFIDMAIEYKEDLIFQKLDTSGQKTDDIEVEVDNIIAADKNGANSTPKTVKMKADEINSEFDNLNLEEY